MLNFKSFLRPAAAILVAMSFGLVSAVALANTNPASTTLPNGAELEVQIDNPIQDQEFKVPAALGAGGTINVPVDGEASVGQGDPNIGLIYILDVSGSTVINSCNSGTVLDCEVEAIVNAQGDPNITSVKEMGLAIFADGGNTADMPGLLTTNPANVITVAESAFSSSTGGNAGVTQFSSRTVGAGETDFSQGLEAALTILGVSTSATDRVFFISDGTSTQQNASGGFAGQLAAMVASGATVDSFAVGVGSDCCEPGSTCENSPTGTLYNAANATGGTCREIPNPADFPNLLPNLLATSLDAVQVAVDGAPVTTNTAPGVPVPGPITVDYDATINKGVGDYNVTATADGSDNAGSDTVTADVDIRLLQLTASPATDTNELNTDNQHTVTAAILGGSGPDRNIDFVVGGQNATTATPPDGSISATPGGASVDFEYTVPQDCASLGTDTITVSTTIAGMVDSIVLEKEWIDTVPPEVSCDPTVNPHGNKEPPAPGQGGQGQNQDGFYQLNAEDPNLANCTVMLVVEDGDGFVFPGPFLPGDKIKYTQDDFIPQEQKKIGSGQGQAGAVRWHLIGHGDLTVTGTDPSGNTSSATCLVPPPPK